MQFKKIFQKKNHSLSSETKPCWHASSVHSLSSWHNGSHSQCVSKMSQNGGTWFNEINLFRKIKLQNQTIMDLGKELVRIRIGGH